LRRKVRGRVHLTNGDRLFLVGLYRWFPSVLKTITIIRPETLVRWHRAGFRRYWRWKQHCSLYPATDRVVAALKDDLAPYEVKKSTIRFPLSQPVPLKLIERIAKLRAKEVTEREKAKAATLKKR
jgi:hypothetical protein